MPPAGASPIVLFDRATMPLVGARLRWKRFRRWTGVRAAAACLGCAEPITEGGEPGLASGYTIVGGGPAGQDDYLWVCAICYEGLRGHFGWVVLDTLGRAIRPAGLWESAFGFEETDDAADPDELGWDRADGNGLSEAWSSSAT